MTRFDEVKDSFWSGSTYGVQQPLTDEAVGETESVLGMTLPSSLLVLLRGQNGGVVADRWKAFPTPTPGGVGGGDAESSQAGGGSR